MITKKEYKIAKQIVREYEEQLNILAVSGKLGFGGKYRSCTNTVDCYKEDETPELIEIKKYLIMNYLS